METTVMKDTSAWREETVHNEQFVGYIRDGKLTVGIRNYKGTKNPYALQMFGELYKTWKYNMCISLKDDGKIGNKKLRAILSVIYMDGDPSRSGRPRPNAFRCFKNGKTENCFTYCEQDSWHLSEDEDGTWTFATTLEGVMLNFCSEAEGTLHGFRIRLVLDEEPILDVISGPFRVYGRARVHHYRTSKAKQEGPIVLERRKRRRINFDGEMDLCSCESSTQHASHSQVDVLRKQHEEETAAKMCIQLINALDDMESRIRVIERVKDACIPSPEEDETYLSIEPSSVGPLSSPMTDLTQTRSLVVPYHKSAFQKLPE